MNQHDPTLKAAHDRSSRHRAEVLTSVICGCFYCRSTFEPGDIGEWVDAVDDGDGLGQTALCPHCGVDSVLGSQSGYPITPEFLATMHQYWFG